MKKHLFLSIFIFILSLVASLNPYSYAYLTILAFVASIINPFYLIALFFMFFKIDYLLIFTIYFILSLFTILLKHFKLSLFYLITTNLYLNIAIYFKSQNALNFYTALTCLFLFSLMIYNIEANIKDKRIYTPILYGLSLGFFIFSSDKTDLSLILSQTLTTPYSLIILLFLLPFSYNNIFYLFLIPSIAALNFIKGKIPFFALSFLLGFILFKINPSLITALVIPTLNIFLNKDGKIILTKSGNIDNYLALLKDDSTDYGQIDFAIKELIKTFCTNCNKKNLCFKKNRLYLYQYLMYQVTSNMKVSAATSDFITNCDYYEMMLKAPKNNILKIATISHVKLISEYFNTCDANDELILNFFKRNNYELTKLENRSRGSINYCFELAVNSISIPLLNFRLSQILNCKTILKKQGDKYYLTKKPLYKISFDSIVLAKGNIYISGDNILIKEYQNDIYFALADGMGSGLKAFEASKSLLKQLEGLIDLGLSDEKIMTELKMLESLAGYKDTYSTIDFIHISKSSFITKLYKVASSNTYLITDRKMITFKTDSLPLAVLGDITAHELELNIGDTLIIASDGVSEVISSKKLTDYIKELANQEAPKIVYDLAKYVFDQSGEKLEDDISIIAIKVKPFH